MASPRSSPIAEFNFSISLHNLKLPFPKIPAFSLNQHQIHILNQLKKQKIWNYFFELILKFFLYF